MSRKSPAAFAMLSSVSRIPSKDLIRSVACGSDDAFMQSDEFWLELARYRTCRNELFEPSADDEVLMIRQGYPASGIAEDILKSLGKNV